MLSAPVFDLLLKIGARLKITVRRLWLSFSETYPIRDEFAPILQKLRSHPPWVAPATELYAAMKNQRLLSLGYARYFFKMKNRSESSSNTGINHNIRLYTLHRDAPCIPRPLQSANIGHVSRQSFKSVSEAGYYFAICKQCEDRCLTAGRRSTSSLRLARCRVNNFLSPITRLMLMNTDADRF